MNVLRIYRPCKRDHLRVGLHHSWEIHLANWIICLHVILRSLKNVLLPCITKLCANKSTIHLCRKKESRHIAIYLPIFPKKAVCKIRMSCQREDDFLRRHALSSLPFPFTREMQPDSHPWADRQDESEEEAFFFLLSFLSLSFAWLLLWKVLNHDISSLGKSNHRKGRRGPKRRHDVKTSQTR